jgi:hypothetical protein
MTAKFSLVCLSIFAVSMSNGALAVDSDSLLSVAKPSSQAVSGTRAQASPTRTSAPAAARAGSSGAGSATKAAGSAVKPGTATSAKAATSDSASDTDADDADQASAPPPATASQALAQAYEAYRAAPTPASLAEVMRTFKHFVGTAGGKVPAAALVKATPVLQQMGARAIGAGSGRIWTFSKLPENNEVVVQYADSKPIVTYVGRRHRTRRVSYALSWHIGSFILPAGVTLQEARILGTGEGQHSIVLVGSEQGSNLWLRTLKQGGGSWVETAGRLDSIPSFLTKGVSGRVSFRGPDLILNVARVVATRADSGPRTLPEADSSTYRFLLHYTDQGYVLMHQLPDEAQFGMVRAFLDAIAANRTDVAKSLLGDGRLLSIAKYVGLRGPSPSFRVVQMQSPPSGAARFRLLTGGKDDLIFEIGKVKDRTVIRALFIAPPDPFLQEIASQLPSYEKVAPAAAADQVSSEKH